MRTLFSDSMVSPRGIDTASVDYRYPITATGNEGGYTRTRRDGYRSKPIQMIGRSVEIIGSLRTQQSRATGVLCVYVWMKQKNITNKNPNQPSAIKLIVIGDRMFGELQLIPGTWAGSTFRVPVTLDEAVDFIQVYTTMDLSAVTVNEVDTTGTVTAIIRPDDAESSLVIADDFELVNTSSTPILINDQFSIGQWSDPDPFA